LEYQQSYSPEYFPLLPEKAGCDFKIYYFEISGYMLVI